MRTLAASLALFTAALAAQSIRVEGRVTTRSGQPIEGALVVWQLTPPVEAKTDSQGAFAIEAPAGGDRAIMVMKAGFMPASFSRQGRTSVLFRLSPTGSITGRVLDADGDPVPRAQVTPLRQSWYERGRRSLFAASITVTADADGIYTFHNLTPGRYYLRVEAKAPAVTTYYPSTLDVAVAAAVDIVQVRRAPGWTFANWLRRCFAFREKSWTSLTLL